MATGRCCGRPWPTWGTARSDSVQPLLEGRQRVGERRALGRRERPHLVTDAAPTGLVHRRPHLPPGVGDDDHARPTVVRVRLADDITLALERVDDGAPTSAMPAAAPQAVEATSTYPAQGGEQGAPTTTIAPGSGAAGAVAVGTAAATGAEASAGTARGERTDDDVILDGSSVVGKPASRAGAHWAGILLSIVLLPAAWFLVHHGQALLAGSVKAFRFGLDTRGAVELGIGALVLAIALWTARRSSVGSFIMGVITLALGVVGLAVPDWANRTVAPFLSDLANHSSLGSDLATYFWTDAATGRFAVIGLALILVGAVSLGAWWLGSGR